MIFHRCLTVGCGQLISSRESYCLVHRPRRDVSARGGGASIRKFRAELFRIANGQCEVVINGLGCQERDPARLEAHHLHSVKAGNDPYRNGLLVCVEHHAMLEGRTPPAAVRRRGSR